MYQQTCFLYIRNFLKHFTPLNLFFFLSKLYSYLKNTYSVFSELNVPGPTPKWVFGNIGEFKDKVKKQNKKYF